MAKLPIGPRLPASSSAAGWANSRVDDSMTWSTISRPLDRSVAPVAELSTMQSASSGGNASVAP